MAALSAQKPVSGPEPNQAKRHLVACACAVALCIQASARRCFPAFLANRVRKRSSILVHAYVGVSRRSED